MADQRIRRLPATPGGAEEQGAADDAEQAVAVAAHTRKHEVMGRSPQRLQRLPHARAKVALLREVCKRRGLRDQGGLDSLVEARFLLLRGGARDLGRRSLGDAAGTPIRRALRPVVAVCTCRGAGACRVESGALHIHSPPSCGAGADVFLDSP